MVRYCKVFNVFKAFSSKIRDPHVFSRPGVRLTEGFSVASNIWIRAVTARLLNTEKPIIFKLEQPNTGRPPILQESALRALNIVQYLKKIKKKKQKKFKEKRKYGFENVFVNKSLSQGTVFYNQFKYRPSWIYLVKLAKNSLLTYCN